MIEKSNQHQPVLLDEVVDNLAIKSNGTYIDATFGRGGHAESILNRLGSAGRLLALDKDPCAVAFASKRFANEKRFQIEHDSFAGLEKFIQSQHLVGKVDGILFDLGVSSPQLDDPDRGFSFMREGKLDMRMNSSSGIDAATWLLTISEQELATVFWEYGEERHSRRIARAIVAARQMTPITTTTALAKIIAEAHPAWQKGKHPATKCFQAIRIAINHELDDLKQGLQQSLDVLALKGRLLVISFHSLEDRLVKHFMRDGECGKQFPARLPIKHEMVQSKMKRIGRAIKPSQQEIATNPRARSAVLRIAEKLS